MARVIKAYVTGLVLLGIQATNARPPKSLAFRTQKSRYMSLEVFEPQVGPLCPHFESSRRCRVLKRRGKVVSEKKKSEREHFTAKKT